MNESPAKQIANMIAEFDPEVARLIRSARTALRKRFPAAIEQVHDNETFLAIGYCTTERASDCIVSVAADAEGVALSFHYGAFLQDPQGILLGSGTQNRFLRLESVATLANPDVQAMLSAAAAQVKSPLRATGRGHTIIKSIAAKRRPRRAVQA